MDIVQKIIGSLLVIWGAVSVFGALGQTLLFKKFGKDVGFPREINKFGKIFFAAVVVIGLVLIGGGIWVYNL